VTQTSLFLKLPETVQGLVYLIVVLILMMLVSTLGSNSYSLITKDAGISAVAARSFV